MQIDSENIDEVHAECRRIYTNLSIIRTQFQSLLSKLICIHKCFHPARIFIDRMLALFRASPKSKKLDLTPEFKMDLNWFLKFMSVFNGITIFDKNLSQLTRLCLIGLGGVWKKEIYCTPAFPIIDLSLKIVYIEMLNIFAAQPLWGARWSLSVVTLFCDNLSVVKEFDTDRTRDSFLAFCDRNIWLLTTSHDITLDVKHIPWASNSIADLLSRIYSNNPNNQELLRKLPNNYLWHNIPVQYLNLDLAV